MFKLLHNIKVDKAAGPDELPNRVLQECASEITPAVTAIFQKSVDSGELPEDWRDANVAPVYKKGDRHTPENYRPVSLTCVLSKRLEHIICHHMLNHLDKHQVLTSLNHGFRSGYSCETQLVVTAHDLLNFYCNVFICTYTTERYTIFTMYRYINFPWVPLPCLIRN